jgi:glycosyltransferase involved in cell wall biosynthesis
MRACMLAYSFYESDNRVMRYAEALATRGDHVEVIALRKAGQPPTDTISGVHLFRIQGRVVNERTRATHLLRIMLFFLRSMYFLTRRHLAARYDLIHVHSVPDFLVFTTCLAKWTGAKIILDIHDLLPEFYASKFGANPDSLLTRTLLRVERVSTAFADHVIIANHLWREKLVSRSVADEKCTALLNFPDTSIFRRCESAKKNDKFVMVFPGSLHWHQGVDIAIRAMALIRDRAPNAEFHIYGEGRSEESLRQLVRELRLEDRVFFHAPLPLRQIALPMENADLGVVPKRTDSFGNEAFSTKVLEFMALGVPVLVSNSKIDRYYFDDSLVHFFRGGDEQDLATCMLRLINDPELRGSLSRKGALFVEHNNWDTKKAEYFGIVESLVRNRVAHHDDNRTEPEKLR